MTSGEEAPLSPPDPHPVAAPARTGTLLLANLTKVAGLIVAVHEAFTTKDPLVLGVAAFMMAGAQVSETMVLGLIDRFLGRDR